MSKTTETTSIEFAEDLLKHSEAIKGAATVDKSTGIISVDKNFFVKHMPEGVTKDSYKAAMAYRDLTINAASHALGEMGVDLMQSNKDLDRVEFKLPTVGGSYVEGGIKRDATYRNMQTGETVTAYGRLVGLTYHDRSSRGNQEMENIKHHLRDMASKALAE